MGRVILLFMAIVAAAAGRLVSTEPAALVETPLRVEAILIRAETVTRGKAEPAHPHLDLEDKVNRVVPETILATAMGRVAAVVAPVMILRAVEMPALMVLAAAAETIETVAVPVLERPA